MIHYQDGSVTVHAGDCLDVLREMADASVDAVVCDPPYGLEFMGREWDKFGADKARIGQGADTARPGVRGEWVSDRPQAYVAGQPFQQWCQAWATECLRVLKPGGHLLAFGGTRTYHRLACGIEDAGFEIRDSLHWIYGSGFPKSLDVSKAIDKAAGAERELGRVLREDAPKGHAFAGTTYVPDGLAWVTLHETAPATDDARTWQGWGTALKPAHEPIVVARKPLAGTVAANVLRYGTGALNVDACRVGTGDRPAITSDRRPGANNTYGDGLGGSLAIGTTDAGRWPPNVVLSPEAAAELDRQSGTLATNPPATWRTSHDDAHDGFLSAIDGRTAGDVRSGFADHGGASRFFPIFRYEAKAPTSERPRMAKAGAGGHPHSLGYNQRRCAGCDVPQVPGNCTCADGPLWVNAASGITAHPTVKPVKLMAWLCKLVCPPGGVILDPFAGSGTTGEAAIVEGFRAILIEREADYLPLIVARLTKRTDPTAYAAHTRGDEDDLLTLLDDGSVA